MASIVRRGKTFSVVHYEGTGKDRHQVWDSGLSYTAAKALKAKLEHEGVVKVKAKGDDMTVSEFLYEFVEKYGESAGSLPPMTEMLACWETMFILIWATKS